MNKRVVLKSVLAVVVAGFILSVSSCQKDEKKIIGTWKYKDMEIKELLCTEIFTEMMIRMTFQMGKGYIAEEMGLGVVEFTKDGKAITRSGNKTDISTYKAADNKLTITNSYGISITVDFSIPKKKEMYWDMDIINLFKDMLEEEEDDETTEIIKFVVKITFEKQ